ncbi:MAG: hypothetical protein DMF72_16580 [Acidobacteria bacterium]|nr:MAG: hypothetical protein DMF72_16580 [Acidobacteriota bacterium]
MQSIDDLARAITELDPYERQALMDRLSKLTNEQDRDALSEASFQAMQEAMKDELFLADLHEVMDDFRYVDSEEAA